MLHRLQLVYGTSYMLITSLDVFLTLRQFRTCCTGCAVVHLHIFVLDISIENPHQFLPRFLHAPKHWTNKNHTTSDRFDVGEKSGPVLRTYWSLQFISRSSSMFRLRKVKRIVNSCIRTKCCRNVMKFISREYSHAIQLNGLTLGNWMIWIFCMLSLRVWAKTQSFNIERFEHRYACGDIKRNIYRHFMRCLHLIHTSQAISISAAVTISEVVGIIAREHLDTWY